MTRLDIPERKVLRASLIRDFVLGAGLRRVVCFSCGNASAALLDAFAGTAVEVLPVTPDGPLAPVDWFEPEAVRRWFPGCFDATSGHLPAPLILAIAERLALDYYLRDGETYEVPTGSGETLLALRMAWPTVRFVASFGSDAATRYDPRCPLARWALKTAPRD